VGVARWAGWPPAAEREGRELSLVRVWAVLAGAMAAQYLLFEAAADATPFATSWSTSPQSAVTRQFVLPAALAAGISLAVVLLLGWYRGAGLPVGRASPWGTIPLGVLLVGAVLSLAQPGVASRGSDLLALVVIGLLFSAVSEEVLFRGFLQHGLSRRLGGGAAVLAGSAVFSAAHVPALVSMRTPGGTIAVTLVVIFGLAVLLCRIRAETGSIWLASGVHALWNVVTIGWVASSAPAEGLETLFAAMKLVPVVMGLVMAVRLGRNRRWVAAPPMPVPIPASGFLLAPVPPTPRSAVPLPPPPPPPGAVPGSPWAARPSG
jgi:membrane protease YdiL (CAAX protease family)